MNWYKKAMALDPGAWETEPDPARLGADQPSVQMPWGKVHQNTPDQDFLKQRYEGTHFTQSENLAAIYANYKASHDDPPVIIEINTTDMQKMPDADVELDMAVDSYIQYNLASDWSNVLDSENTEEKKAEQILDIANNAGDDYEYSSGYEDVSTIGNFMAQESRVPPPSVVVEYLNSLVSDNEVISAANNMINGNIPQELMIQSVNQFRIMQPIITENVVAIYKVPLIALDHSSNESFEYLDMLSPEELAEKGFTRKDDGFYNEEDRLIMDYEDIIYSGVSMVPLYKNNQLQLNQLNLTPSETAWHGTSLSRAKQAFPELLS